MRACPRCFSAYVTDVEFCGLDGERLITTQTDPLIGKTVDRYEILERLGHGGMSVVYRARHEVIGHEYALKVPYGEISLDRQFAERLRREAQVMAQLDHPNVARVFDFATTPGGASFLVMELLLGRSLSRAIIDDGPMKPKTAARLFRQIALGLEAAHELGFVHRDLKPGNVMLVGDPGSETAKILDFGLVHVLEAGSANDTARAQLTETGVAMGTPLYMAPEQMRGEAATPLSDIYSLGAVLFEMLSGLPPYCGSLPDLLVKQATKPPPTPPPSGGLENIARSMLEREPSRRPRTVGDVVAAVDRLDLGAAPHPRPEEETRTIRRPAAESGRLPVTARPRGRSGAFAMIAAISLAAAVAFWLQRDDGAAERLDDRYQEVVRSASRTLKEVDRDLVTSMAELGQSLEQKSAEACSVKSLPGRLSRVTKMIDRAPKGLSKKQMAAFVKRARILRRAIDEGEVTPKRCRVVARSISRLERDWTRAVRARRS